MLAATTLIAARARLVVAACGARAATARLRAARRRQQRPFGRHAPAAAQPHRSRQHQARSERPAEGRHAEPRVGRGLGAPRSGPVVLPDRLPGRVRRPSGRCTRSRRTATRRCRTCGLGAAADQLGRQDRHGAHQARRACSAAPVNRDVTSDDVKYAFERDFNPNVPNGYADGYYPIVGADKSKGGPISGITTPDKTTIVFHLTKHFGATFAQALTLPGSAPVPQRVREPMRQEEPVDVRRRRRPSRRSAART